MVYPHIRPPGLLSPAERAGAPLSREWLVGYWVQPARLPDLDPCSEDGDTALLPDGTYVMADGAGTWTFEGSRLTITVTREPTIRMMWLRLGDGGVARVRKLGPNEISVRWPGSAGIRFVRCD